MRYARRKARNKKVKYVRTRRRLVASALKSLPNYPLSSAVKGLSQIRKPFIIGTGDMWPITWASDGNLYAGAGDNSGFLDYSQKMNLWRITGTPPNHDISLVNSFDFVRDFMEADPGDPEIPFHLVGATVKPAGVVSVNGVLYLAVEDMKYTSGRYGNQISLQSWIMASTDYGTTWSEAPPPGSEKRAFLTGIFASPHFLQFGKDYSGARDKYVYAYSCAGDDGVAAWSAGDWMYLARVPRDSILERKAWQFCVGGSSGKPTWSRNLEKATPVFQYQRKTGENEVVYNAGLNRYILLNWAFTDCVAHEIGSRHSELTVFEAAEPWGPWSLVYLERDWGQNCDYQPRLPTKWMSQDGKKAWLVSAGNFWKDGGEAHYGFGATEIELDSGSYGDIELKSELGVVEGVKTAPLSPTEIKLSWLPSLNAHFYRIFRDGNKLVDTPRKYPARYRDQSLTPHTEYTYNIQAFAACGDSSPISEEVKAGTLPSFSGDSIGVNLGGEGVVTKKTMWLGEESAYVKVIECDQYVDQRIRELPLTPNSGEMEAILRSFRGHLRGVKLVIGKLPFTKARVFVYAINTKLSQMETSFEIYIEGARVAKYGPSVGDNANWHKLGPFAVEIKEGANLSVEGRKFVGLGGMAAILIEKEGTGNP